MHRADGSDELTHARLDIARALGLAGVVAYNWWVVVPFVPGLMPSPNGFFSDLEATGGRDATWMQHCDVAAGILLVTAFVVRGAAGRDGYRPEWKWMVAFAAAGGVGGAFPYACAEGLSATCRTLEWHLELPFHHYVHVVAGIAEFVFLTVAVLIAHRRTTGHDTREAHAYRWLWHGLLVAYPLLGLAYLTDRLGTVIEPVFFVIFSTMVVVQLFEPSGDGRPGDIGGPLRLRRPEAPAVPAGSRRNDG
jgi:hypothetical protein